MAIRCYRLVMEINFFTHHSTKPSAQLGHRLYCLQLSRLRSALLCRQGRLFFFFIPTSVNSQAVPPQPPQAHHPAPAPPAPTAGQSHAATSATRSFPSPPSPAPENPNQPAGPSAQTAADRSPPHPPYHNPPPPTGKKS